HADAAIGAWRSADDLQRANIETHHEERSGPHVSKHLRKPITKTAPLFCSGVGLAHGILLCGATWSCGGSVVPALPRDVFGWNGPFLRPRARRTALERSNDCAGSMPISLTVGLQPDEVSGSCRHRR